MIRNPLFLGIGGLEEWKETLRTNKRRKERHERDKYLAWAFILKQIDESIEDKIVIMNNYDLHYANHDVLFLWNACREIATGVGGQSAGVVLSKAMNLKLSNDE